MSGLSEYLSERISVHNVPVEIIPVVPVSTVGFLALLYLIIINFIGFMLFKRDKKKAKKGLWRTREASFVLISLLGGGIGCLIASKVYKHKTKKYFLKFLIVLSTLVIVAVFSVPFVSWHVVSIGEKSVASAEDVRQGDAIVVLGASVKPDGTVSLMLGDRLDMALQLYENNKAPKILVSGDHGEVYYNEVGAMRDYLIEHGVPSEDIFMDHAGFNTYDSMYRAKEVFQIERPIVVSQHYHIVRASYIGHRLGMDMAAVAADTMIYYGTPFYEAREYGARYKAFIECIKKQEPEHLGETIPISGNGEETLDRDKMIGE